MAPPKRPWFRLYTETIWDRKIRRLPTAFRWLWVAILACARTSPTPGFLLLTEGEPMSWDDLADAAAMKLKDVEKGTDALSDLGLIAFDPALNAWFIPKWNERQYESDVSTDRATKHRSKNADATSMQRSIGVVATHQKTETEKQRTETDTERARARNIAAAKWKPNPQLLEWVSRELPEVDIVVETEKFIDHFSANGKPMKDWDAAWRNWMRRSREFAGRAS